MQHPIKQFIEPNLLHKYSFDLAVKIKDSDFNPTWIIALWRGGCQIGVTIQGFLKYFGCAADHFPIRTSSYDTSGQQREIRVDGLEYVVKNMKADDKVLLVDDIFDSGRTIKAVIDELKRQLHTNYPENVRIATVFYKPSNNKVDFKPDYYCEETDKWLVFSHEFEDLTKDEIKTLMGIDMPA